MNGGPPIIAALVIASAARQEIRRATHSLAQPFRFRYDPHRTGPSWVARPDSSIPSNGSVNSESTANFRGAPSDSGIIDEVTVAPNLQGIDP